MPLSTIYCISFDNCDSVYYGSTIDFDRRIKEHKRLLKNNKHTNNILQGIYNQYDSGIKVEKIASCPAEYQYKLEQWFIDTQSCVNIFPVAGGGLVKGKEVCQYDLHGNFINSFKTTRQAKRETGTDSGRIVICCKRREGSAGGFQWRYATDKLESISPFKRPNSVRVNQYSLNGDFIKTYDSMTTATEDTGVGNKEILYCCEKKYKTAYGFQWRYFEDHIEALDPVETFNKKKVEQYTLNGTKLATYRSVMHASQSCKIQYACIWRAVRGKASRAGRYKWKYVEE